MFLLHFLVKRKEEETATKKQTKNENITERIRIKMNDISIVIT